MKQYMNIIFLGFIQWLMVWMTACTDATVGQQSVNFSEPDLEVLASYADSSHVVDLASVLTEEQRNELIRLLDDYTSQNGLEFGLYIVPELGNIGIQELSLAVSGKMKVGNEGMNNGGIIFMAVQERQVKIEINYGLEWQISTLQAAQILDQIRPQLSSGDYYKAFVSAFSTMFEMGSQASWKLAYPDFAAMNADKENALGKIVSFTARGQTRDYNSVPLDTQFSDDLFINVFPKTGDPIRLNFSNYMVEMANAIIYSDEPPRIFARVASLEPFELNLLGILP